MERDLAIKHQMIIKDKERFYYLNLSDHQFNMEKTTPRELVITPLEETIESSSWVHMVIDLVNLLQEKNPKSKEELISFKLDWSDKLSAFSYEKYATNWHELKCGLYVNCNMTSVHFLWFLTLIVKFYGISPRECVLTYKRMPSAEPKEIKDAVIKDTKEGFANMLKEKHGYSDEKIAKIIRNIEYLNGFIDTFNTGYNNFFMFDSSYNFSAFKIKFLEKFSQSKYASNPKNVELAKRYVYLLSEYYNKGFVTYKSKVKNIKYIGKGEKRSKYSVIEDYLKTRTEDYIFMSFKDFEELLDIELPPAAYKSCYWHPNGHSLPNHFIKAGYNVKVNINKCLIYMFKIKE